MKKLFAMLMAVTMLGSLAACGQSAPANQSSASSSSSQAATAAQTEAVTTTQSASKPSESAQTEASETSSHSSTENPVSETTTQAGDSPETSQTESTDALKEMVYAGMSYDEAISDAVEKAGGGTAVSAELQTDDEGVQEWVIGVKKDGESDVEYVHVKNKPGAAIETPLR